MKKQISHQTEAPGSEPKREWKPRDPRFNLKHPTVDVMRDLLGSKVVDQYEGKSWVVTVPAGETSESAELAIRLGKYDLEVIGQIVFVKPKYEKWF